MQWVTSLVLFGCTRSLVEHSASSDTEHQAYWTLVQLRYSRPVLLNTRPARILKTCPMSLRALPLTSEGALPFHLSLLEPAVFFSLVCVPAKLMMMMIIILILLLFLSLHPSDYVTPGDPSGLTFWRVKTNLQPPLCMYFPPRTYILSNGFDLGRTLSERQDWKEQRAKKSW